MKSNYIFLFIIFGTVIQLVVGEILRPKPIVSIYEYIHNEQEAQLFAEKIKTTNLVDYIK